MREHVEGRRAVRARRTSPAAEAIERFRGEGQDYKVELIEDLVDDRGRRDRLALHATAPFTDLCRGPHAPGHEARSRRSSCTRVAGAYWRGDDEPPDAHAHLRHRLLLARRSSTRTSSGSRRRARATTASSAASSTCSCFSEQSPGLAVLAARTGWCSGTSSRTLRRRENARARLRRGARRRSSTTRALEARPATGTSTARTCSSRDVRGPAASALKPMNCPAHMQLYGVERRSYRDLPMRFAELGPRPPQRARAARCTACCACAHFTQDDAHIFCTEEQIEDEVDALPRLRLRDLRHVRLRAARSSSRPGRRSGSAPTRCGTRPRRRSQRRSSGTGLEYELNEGDGAFYGPKIDLHMTDALGRSWQLGTVQLDYQMPERFDLTYTGADNAEHRPVMIHRALLGSFERFIGILIEHYARRVPALAGAGAGDRAADRRPPRRRTRARSPRELREAGLRVEVDDAHGVGRASKIRDAELRKIPYMLVVGDRGAGGGAGRGAPPRRGRPRARCAGSPASAPERSSPDRAPLYCARMKALDSDASPRELIVPVPSIPLAPLDATQPLS